MLRLNGKILTNKLIRKFLQPDNGRYILSAIISALYYRENFISNDATSYLFMFLNGFS